MCLLRSVVDILFRIHARHLCFDVLHVYNTYVEEFWNDQYNRRS